MSISALSFIFAFLISGPFQGSKVEAPVRNKGLLMQLTRMVKSDQELRNLFTKEMQAGREPAMDLLHKLEKVDRDNTAAMRQIIKTYGWPTSALVGKSGASMAWLLVQHADQNPGFQRECLDLMEPLLATGEVSKSNFAYLTDRVLLAEGKKQLYGTQFAQNSKGQWEPRDLEDPANLDRRRADMGLGTIADYRKQIEMMYGTKPPVKSTD